jgi:hypothetical protein
MRQAGQDQDQPGSLPPKRQRGPGLSRLACGHHVDPGGAAIQRGNDVQPHTTSPLPPGWAAGAVRLRGVPAFTAVLDPQHWQGPDYLLYGQSKPADLLRRVWM